MNWDDAVKAMRAGSIVRRKSQCYRKLVKRADLDLSDIAGAPIYETGMEGCRLMHAWTAEESPALVFSGAESGVLFVPDDEDRGAEDWEVQP